MSRTLTLAPILGALLLTVFVPRSFAQETDPDDLVPGQEGKRLSHEQEREKFHPTKVTGTSAADRARGYDARLQLESASVFGGVKWRSIGPEIQGGRVVVIKAPKDDPKSIYVAYATGGLWRTTNDGQTWTSLFDGQSAFGIGALALSHDGKTIWVGSGEANNQRTSYSGTGIFKSTDAGATWQNMGLPESQHIGQIVINPRNENVVYVAALGHLYSQNPERGVYKTMDGGKTWNLVLKGDEFTGAMDLVMDPKNPDVLVASLYDRDRRAWNFRGSGPGSGVYRSANGGRSWARVRGLPTGYDAGRIGLGISESNPSRLYAFLDDQGSDEADWKSIDEHVPAGRLTARRFLLLNDETLAQIDPEVLNGFLRTATNGEIKAADVLRDVKAKKLTFAQLRALIADKYPNVFDPGLVGEELYRSDDGGMTWRRTATGRFGVIGGYYYDSVFVDPTNPDDLYVTGLPLLHSTDGGKTWADVAHRAHVDFHAVWHDPRQPGKIWMGNDGGLYVSYDGGVTTTHVNNVAVGQATTIAVDNKQPYGVYIGLQDNGTMKGPSNYQAGQSDPNAWKSIGGGDGSAIAIDPTNDGDLVYVSSQFGSFEAIDQATNARWGVRPTPPKDDPQARYNWIAPIVVSPHSPNIVYVGAQRLYRSFNQGRRFEPISPDVTKNRPNGNVPFSTIKDISESPLRFGLIYLGCDDGNVKMTPDGGYQWVDIPTPQPNKWVSRVVASRYDESTVYVAQNGYREDDFAPYLWKSTDRGKTWRSIVGNLPGESINVVREDPSRKDLLYVGTDMGVFVTYDGGLSWEALQGGLPHTPVHDIAVQPRENEMVIASHARSVWALSLKAVHDLTPEIRRADLKLFTVDDAIHLTSWGYDHRDRWDGRLPNEPTVKVDFFVKDPGKGAIRIKDKTGKVVKEKSVDAVRGFNYLTIGLQLTPPRPAAAPVRQVKTVQDVLADPYAATRATYLAPGTYTIEVQVGSHTASQSWRVRD
jgi:photosystem II stability/assembly factor-like uncharacterized protein